MGHLVLKETNYYLWRRNALRLHKPDIYAACRDAPWHVFTNIAIDTRVHPSVGSRDGVITASLAKPFLRLVSDYFCCPLLITKSI